MADGDPIAFTRGAADRIAAAVRTVEIGSRGGGGIEWDTQQPASGFKLKVATFTGNWETGTYKTVTLSGSTQTASVFNLCNPALGLGTAETSCTRYVIFGKAGGTSAAVEVQFQATCQTCHMTLGSFDLTQLPGYDSASIQMLGHNTTGPCLEWYSITTCSTAAT